MKWLWNKLRVVAGVLVIVGVVLLIANPADFVALASALTYFALDRFSRLFFPPTAEEQRIRQGQCPSCCHDLSKIIAGQTTCPNCGEAVPAPLRKWGSN